VSPGDRVAIMSRTSYEWSLLDFAIWEAGAVPVPIYETSSTEQVAWILRDSGAVAVFTELPANTATVESVRDQADTLKDVWQIEPNGTTPGALAMLAEAGAAVGDEVLAERRASLLPESTATIIYTSGTTGRPKGCVLTHENLLFDAGNAVTLLTRIFKGDETTGASTLLFLPLAHVFARIINVGTLMARAKLGYCGDTKQLMPELASFQPTFC
jgi:long-chain acyl-CoA synthetase